MRLRQAGDTIVEVMIVLAVLGLALSISYATANRALLQARQAQENSEAATIARGQLEGLRTLTRALSTDATHYIFRTDSFCLVQVGNDTQVKDATYSTAGPGYNIGDPKPECKFGNIPYVVQISYTQTDPGPPALNVDRFTITVTWPDVMGEGNDTVTLEYRVHPSQQ